MTPSPRCITHTGQTPTQCKLSADGSLLLYSTYLSNRAAGFETGKAITVDADGRAFVVGSTGDSGTG